MASGFPTFDGEINGIDFANYIPVQRSFNNVVYIHKRCLTLKNKITDKDSKPDEKKKHKKRKNEKQDKTQQANIEEINKHSKKAKTLNDSLIQQTIQFAKNIVPLTIPPSRDISPPPVFYTVKTSKKKPKEHKTTEKVNNQQDPGAVQKSKRVTEYFRKEKIKSHRESVSVHESISHSYQSTTIEELSSLSEISERKHRKTDRYVNKNKLDDKQKFIASESFEAIATELNNTGETKLKIHLMNDKDKYQFSDSIRIPVINAIKECIADNCIKNNNELLDMQKFLMCNSQALNGIIEKLLCLEKKIDFIANERYKTFNMEQAKATAAAQMQLNNVDNMKENVSEEELYETSLIDDDKLKDENGVVTLFTRESRNEGSGSIGKRQDLGGGELPPLIASDINTEVKTGRPNRIPTRFCWTDSVRN